MLTFIKNLREEDHQKAFVATLVFIMLMILFFLLVSLEYPNPPLEEKIVEVEIEFGSDFSGGGQFSESVEIPEPEPESAIKQDVQTESPVVVTTSNGNSSTSKNTSTTKPNTDPKPDPKPKVDDGLAFPGGGSAGSGGGSGSGFGTGGGVGDGGSGNQPGAGTTNTSRKLKSKGQIPGNSQEEGSIALDLYVDEFGNVVRTKRNESKSTSGSAYLTDLAQKNAKTYKYEAIPGAPVQYVGTVVFNFRKQ
jgi:hypothetical protein